MNIKDHLTSLELSKQLAELGIKKDTAFYWLVDQEGNAIISDLTKSSMHKKTYYSAFLATELLEILPNSISTKENEPFNHFRLRIEKCFLYTDNYMQNVFIMNYRCDTTESAGLDAWLERTLLPHNVYSRSLPDAVAKMLIRLVELKKLVLED